eukprot:UN31066
MGTQMDLDMVDKGIIRVLTCNQIHRKRKLLLRRQKKAKETELAEKWLELKTIPLEENEELGEDEMKDLSGDLSLWYGQMCLVCKTPLSLKSLTTHFQGARHLKKFKNNPRRPNYERIWPELKKCLTPTWVSYEKDYPDYSKEFPNYGNFPVTLTVDEWTDLCEYNLTTDETRILVIGEQDFGYCQSLHDISKKNKIYATTNMNWEINDFDFRKRLADAQANGIQCLTQIDATSSEHLKKLMEIAEKMFDSIVILYPQVVENIRNVSEPLNSEYLSQILKAINETKMLKESGMVQILLNHWELTDWDLYQIGLDNGYFLQATSGIHTTALNKFQLRDYR